MVFILLIIIGIILGTTILHLDIIKCKNSIKEDNYTISNNFKIYYKKNIVKKVIIEKEVKSKNNTILSYFIKSYEDEYKKYNKEYGGYKLSTKNSKNKKILIIEWNLEKVNYEKLKTGRNYLKDDIKNKTITVNGIYKILQISKKSCK